MTDIDALLAEQIAYYRARAPEYTQSTGFGPDVSDAEVSAAAAAIEPALDDLGPLGDVLELACGPGTFTAALARRARTLTAVDASPEMLALAQQALPDGVRLLEADLFTWTPDHRYDTVFFGFWLSHVPLERFERFWETVATALRPGGQVVFVDDGYRTAEELVYGAESTTIERQIGDGRRFRAVKVPHDARSLEQRLNELGWQVAVRHLPGPFYIGYGRLRPNRS